MTSVDTTFQTLVCTYLQTKHSHNNKAQVRYVQNQQRGSVYSFQNVQIIPDFNDFARHLKYRGYTCLQIEMKPDLQQPNNSILSCTLPHPTCYNKIKRCFYSTMQSFKWFCVFCVLLVMIARLWKWI
jgi:hypothetical protein